MSQTPKIIASIALGAAAVVSAANGRYKLAGLFGAAATGMGLWGLGIESPEKINFPPRESWTGKEPADLTEIEKRAKDLLDEVSRRIGKKPPPAP